MAAEGNPPAATAGTNNPNEQDGPVANMMNAVLRGVVMYMMLNMMQKFSNQATTTPSPPTPGMNGNNINGDIKAPQKMKPRGALDLSYPGQKVDPAASSSQQPPKCLWQFGSVLDLDMFISDQPDFTINDCTNSKKRKDTLAEWHQSNIVFVSKGKTVSIPDPNGKSDEMLTFEKDNQRTTNLTIPITHKVQFNETHIYAHICVTRKFPKANDDNKKKKTDYSKDILVQTVQLTKHRKRKRQRNEKSLLADGDTDANENGTSMNRGNELNENPSPLTIASANKTEDAILLYLKPALRIQLVDLSSLPPLPVKKSIPASIRNHLVWYNDTETETETSLYYPIVYNSEFWITKSSLIEVNDTLQTSNIEVKFEDISFMKWSFMAQMEETWHKQEKYGDEDDAGTDMLRTMLMETNPILLAVTAIVSLLHTIFDILAFKNDIKFFKGKKSMEGLSIRSMVVNTFFQLIILLYLMDNETSFMILVSNGVGVAIDMWKISKAVKLSFFDDGGNWKFEWIETETYTQSKTKEYDEIATDHLMFITMPLVMGYGVYSLFHQKHKGWYSWILNTLVGFIYMFGFVMMTPQVSC